MSKSFKGEGGAQGGGLWVQCELELMRGRGKGRELRVNCICEWYMGTIGRIIVETIMMIIAIMIMGGDLNREWG